MFVWKAADGRASGSADPTPTPLDNIPAKQVAAAHNPVVSRDVAFPIDRLPMLDALEDLHALQCRMPYPAASNANSESMPGH